VITDLDHTYDLAVDLREIESFVAVAEELHFGRAARRVHVSQPALSQRIQRLERELGFALLVRNRRRVTLTPAGTVVLERGRRLLGDARDTVTTARRVADGRAGALRLGYVGAAMYGALPPVVRRLHHAAPDVEVIMAEHKTATQLELLERGGLDAGFIHLPAMPLPGFVVTELDREKLVVALAAGHPLTARRRVPMSALAGEPFVLFDRALEPDTHDRIMQACAMHGFRPRVVQEAANLQGLIGLVAAGLGVAFVAQSAARAMRREGVAFRPVIPAILELTNAVVWRADHVNPAIARLASALWAHRAAAVA
jgi:DNA-binding transcriptional LysR family regulator